MTLNHWGTQPWKNFFIIYGNTRYFLCTNSLQSKEAKWKL